MEKGFDLSYLAVLVVFKMVGLYTTLNLSFTFHIEDNW